MGKGKKGKKGGGASASHATDKRVRQAIAKARKKVRVRSPGPAGSGAECFWRVVHFPQTAVATSPCPTLATDEQDRLP